MNYIHPCAAGENQSIGTYIAVLCKAVDSSLVVTSAFYPIAPALNRQDEP